MRQTVRYLCIRAWLMLLRLAHFQRTTRLPDLNKTVLTQESGQFKQQGSLVSKNDFVAQPEIVLTTSANAELSINKGRNQMFNILTIVSAVEAAFSAAEAVEKEFAILKPYITQFMNAAETAYASSTTSGSSKLAAVMAATKAVAASLGVSWSGGLEQTVETFIGVAKDAFNAFASVVTAVAPNSTGGVASAVNAVSSAASAASTTLASLSAMSPATSSAA
jgi:hypothetical protein